MNNATRLGAIGLLAAVIATSSARAQTAADPQLAAAEALIDAFYSFDPAPLREALAHAPESLPPILFYQGWAQGGNYVVAKREPCRFAQPGQIRCDITVKDDLVAALGTGYDVTDAFHISLKNGRIVKVRTTSNDPPEVKASMDWLIRERPELMEGPCKGFFAGGPTPQDCARAVIKGMAEFKKQQRR